MKSVGVYHIQDSVENFKVRIRIREVSNPQHGNIQTKSNPYEEEIIISWQEKVFGPRDILDYLVHKRSAQGIPSQLDTRRHLSNLEKSGQDISSMLTEVMLCSYINDEPYYPTKRQILDISDERETYLSHASSSLSEKSKEDNRVMKVFNRWIRDTGVKSMHICLATDIDPKNIKGGSFFSSGPEICEKNLVTLSLTKNGLLIASPPFSSPITEDPRPKSDFGITHDNSLEGLNLVSRHSVAPSVFLSDSVVEEAVKKGFRLNTYRVRSNKGVDYEYTIENINGVISPIELEEIIQAEYREDIGRAQQSRGKVQRALEAENNPDVDINWKQVSFTPPYTTKRTIYLEIISAVGFGDGDPLYVKYQAQLPENWKLFETNTNQNDIQNFDKLSEKPQPLSGFTQLSTVSSDSSYLRSIILPSQNNQSPHTELYRPVDLPPIFMHNDSIGRFIIGTLFFATTGFSVALGPEYPLWIVPALFFLFFLGYGSLPIHPRVILYSDSKSQSWEVTSGIVEPIAALGHTTSAQFLINDQIDKQLISPSATQLTLYFEVYTVSMYKRHTLEGCGYLVIPDSTNIPGGTEIRDVSTWKPIGDHNSRLTDFFLGGGAHLVDMSCIEIPNKKLSGLNKFGVRTEPSGSVRFKFSIVNETNIPLKSDDTIYTGKQPTVVRRTVEDILSSYRSADLLNKSISRMNFRSQNSSPMRTPRSSQGLFSLDSTDDKGSSSGILSISSDRIADIIARARATTANNNKGESKLSTQSDTLKETTGIAMARRNNNNQSQKPSDPQVMNLLANDSGDDLDSRGLGSRSGNNNGGGESLSLLDRFEASGITRRAPMSGRRGQGQGQGQNQGYESDIVSSPMHSAPSTPIRERRPRSRYNDSSDTDDDR